jgi:hypothetical protein
VKLSNLVWCIGAGIFLGCATTPQAPLQQDGAKVASATAKKDPKEGLICEKYKVTGSHITKEICRTKEQAVRDRQQAEKMLQEADKFRPGEGN